MPGETRAGGWWVCSGLRQTPAQAQGCSLLYSRGLSRLREQNSHVLACAAAPHLFMQHLA